MAFDSVAYRRKYYLAHKEKEKEYSTRYNRLKRIGITEPEYQEKLESQKGVCAICAKTCTKALAADHNHSTRKIRGLLCNNCNRGLGHFKDNQELLIKAANYLDHYSSK